MTQVTWDKTTERVYEAGVDRGVLYPEAGSGVAWNGLVSIKDKSVGGTPNPYYLDGVKYLNVAASIEFEVSIEAFTYPEEFEECEGIYSVSNGIVATQQNQKSFGLSYRTEIGNNIYGIDYGYKIHLVYNALATPSEKNYESIKEIPDIITFVWDVTTTPIFITGFKAMAHLIIDSTKMDPYILNQFESILYGSETTDARLPSISELKSSLDSSRFIMVISNPDKNLLSPEAIEGDIVFSVSNGTVYSYGPSANNTHPVFVISGNNTVPRNIKPDDVVYNKTTGIFYKLGE